MAVCAEKHEGPSFISQNCPQNLENFTQSLPLRINITIITLIFRLICECRGSEHVSETEKEEHNIASSFKLRKGCLTYLCRGAHLLDPSLPRASFHNSFQELITSIGIWLQYVPGGRQEAKEASQE